MRFLYTPVLSAVFLLAAVPGFAQKETTTHGSPDPVLINLDSPVVPARGAGDIRLQLRGFSDEEGVTYSGVGLQYGLASRLSVLARGMFATETNFALSNGDAIRHGGNDIELAAKYSLSRSNRVAGLIGVAFPNTPARQDAALTLAVSATTPVGRYISAYLNPRAVILKDNSIFGIGLGGSLHLTDTAAIVGDYTPIVSGDNSRNTTDGSLRKTNIYGVALRLSSLNDPNTTFDVGVTNGTGLTTGSALTSGLGGTAALYVGLTFRR